MAANNRLAGKRPAISPLRGGVGRQGKDDHKADTIDQDAHAPADRGQVATIAAALVWVAGRRRVMKTTSLMPVRRLYGEPVSGRPGSGGPDRVVTRSRDPRDRLKVTPVLVVRWQSPRTFHANPTERGMPPLILPKEILFPTSCAPAGLPSLDSSA